jgi:hypothetical protein
MKHNKQKIGQELQKELNKGYDIFRIANWAHDLYFFSKAEFVPEIENILESIFMMQSGPEFEYSEQELRLLVKKLINNEKNKILKGIFHLIGIDLKDSPSSYLHELNDIIDFKNKMIS